MASKIQHRKGSEKAERTGNPLALNKRLFDLKEAAIYLGRPVFSVRTLIWNGALPVIKKDRDRKMYLDIYDMNRFIEENKVTLV